MSISVKDSSATQIKFETLSSDFQIVKKICKYFEYGRKCLSAVIAGNTASRLNFH